MRRFLATILFIVLGAGAAMSGDRVSHEDREAVRDRLAQIGCDGHDIERDGRHFEIDDAECPTGVYDIELDDNLDIVELERD